MKLFKTFLDFLPFDGQKTKIGAILALAAVLQQFVPGLDLVALIQQLLTENLDVTAMATLILGAAHKFLKAKK